FTTICSTTSVIRALASRLLLTHFPSRRSFDLIKNVCIGRGIGINIMCSGLFKIVSPWKENSSTNINSRPAVVAPSNLGRNSFSRSQDHTSELQSRFELVCHLLLEKYKEGRTLV